MGGEVRIYRRRLSNWLVTVGESMFGLIFLSAMFVTDGGEPPRLVQRLGCGALLTVTIVLIVRTLRLAIVATGQGVVVRNFLSTSKHLWPDIESFGRPAAYGSFRKAGLRIRLRSGDVVTATAYAPGPLDRRGVADHVVAELEAMRQAHTVPSAP